MNRSNKQEEKRAMTIKRQLFISNIRVVLVTLIGLILAGLSIRIALFSFPGDWGFDIRELVELRRYHSEAWSGIKPFVFFTLFVVVISAINNLLTLRLMNSIVRPLKALCEGGRQLHDLNLAYRINYRNNDEFRPACDAFDEMAAKLEASAAEHQKNEANRRELIAGISHDLRTPLTSIKGYLEGLEAGVASTPAMREKYFSTIKSKTSDLEHIIEQLFLFSKLDMDEFPLTLRRLPIVQAVRNIIEEIAGEYAMRGLDIHFTELPPDMAIEEIVVFADTLYLRSVIINILENSVTHKAKERGRMEISFGRTSNAAHDGVTLRFVDDGPGVAGHSLGKIFEAHYRADPSRNKKGSGLGLAIISKIIERSGGSCRAELPEGGGLAIVISLPVQQGAAQ